MDYLLWTTCYGLLAMDCYGLLWTACYGLLAMDCLLLTACHGLLAMDYLSWTARSADPNAGGEKGTCASPTTGRQKRGVAA